MSKNLDNKGMAYLAAILSSKARVEVLSQLCLLQNPVGLRKLARICGLHPRSVELALAGLIEEERVSKDSKRENPSYVFNWSHKDAIRLQKVFETDTAEVLKQRSLTLQSRAEILCSFIDDGLELLERGRSSLHAP